MAMNIDKRLAAAAACALAATALLLVGVQVWRWQGQLDRGDALFNANVGRASNGWKPGAAPVFDPSKTILGIGDDLAYRHALQLFWLARPLPLSADSGGSPAGRVRAQNALANAAEVQPSRYQRSMALNLLGLLQVTTTPPEDLATRAEYFNQALTYFRQAIETDPSNSDAKVNLEIALRASREHPDIFPNIGDTSGSVGGALGGAGTLGSGY